MGDGSGCDDLVAVEHLVADLDRIHEKTARSRLNDVPLTSTRSGESWAGPLTVDRAADSETIKGSHAR